MPMGHESDLHRLDRYIISDIDRQRLFRRNGKTCLQGRNAQLGNMTRSWKTMR